MVLKDKRLEDFNKILPCKNCKYNGICKFAGTIPVIETPDIFSVKYFCKLQKKIEEGSNAVYEKGELAEES